MVTKPKGNKHKRSFEHQPTSSDNGDLGYEQHYHLDMTDSIMVPHATMVYPDGASMTGHVVHVDDTRIAHSPLRELNGASGRTQTMVKVLDTVK